MKKIKKIIVGLILSVGLALASNATICATVRIFCDDGTGGNVLICGETYEEINNEVKMVHSWMCR